MEKMHFSQKHKMTHTLATVVQNEVSDLAYKAAGLRYLFENFQPHGSGARDGEGYIGIGMLLREIEGRGFRLAQLLDEAQEPNLSREVEISWADADPLVRVERQVEQ